VNGKLKMEYALNKMPGGEKIHVAVVERTMSNYVSRGENSGRKLEHSNVVRFFSTFPARQSGNIICEVPPISGDALVVLYLQGGDMKIVGALARELK
jgi:hypothetical protein